jgi:hypothetical protein
MSKSFIVDETTKTITLTSRAIIISSCQANKCHPENCGCGNDDYVIWDYIEYADGSGRTYLGTVLRGSHAEMDFVLQASKAKNKIEYTKTTEVTLR